MEKKILWILKINYWNNKLNLSDRGHLEIDLRLAIWKVWGLEFKEIQWLWEIHHITEWWYRQDIWGKKGRFSKMKFL